MQTSARRALREISDAEDENHAERALDRSCNFFSKWPKAVAKLTRDREALLAFYDYPVQHWIHLPTIWFARNTFRVSDASVRWPGSRDLWRIDRARSWNRCSWFS